MSLDVPLALIDRAERGEAVDDDEFIAVIRDSLPYAWDVVAGVAVPVGVGEASFRDHAIPPATEQERGQLLRALASDAIRGALQRYFGVTLAFQNCHRVAAFAPSAVDGAEYRTFVSARGQVLNQTPELRNC